MLAWLQETQMNPDKIPMSAAALKFKAHMKAARVGQVAADLVHVRRVLRNF